MRKKAVILNEHDDKIFKVEAYDDTLYIQAPTKEDAHLQLTEKIGFIPEHLLTWTEVNKLPKDEEFL
jgi:hypothetical protein